MLTIVFMTGFAYTIGGFTGLVFGENCFREGRRVNPGLSLQMTGTVTPETPAFGDVITVAFVVRGMANGYVPGSLQATFASGSFTDGGSLHPYAQVGPIVHETTHSACNLLEQRWTVQLVCNGSSACLPSNLEAQGERLLARVAYRPMLNTRDGRVPGEEKQLEYKFPQFSVDSRVTAEELSKPVLDVGSLAEPSAPGQTTRHARGVLLTILAGLFPALALAGGYVLLGGRLWSRRRDTKDPNKAVHDAVAALEDALEQATVREALHELAHVLRSHPDAVLQDLGRHADRWSAAGPAPERDAVTEFLHGLRQQMHGPEHDTEAPR
jgi:hypothetical protein